MFSKFKKILGLESAIEIVNFNKFLDIGRNKGYGFVFIGSKGCPWCKKLKDEVEKNLSVYDSNYPNITIKQVIFPDEDTYVDKFLFKEDDEGIAVPQIIFFKNKKFLTVSGYVPFEKISKMVNDFDGFYKNAPADKVVRGNL